MRAGVLAVHGFRRAMNQTALLKAPLGYYGGKARLASEIAALLPQNRTYVEPFGGMCSVLLARPPANDEIVNDAAEWVINFWRWVRDDPDEVAHICETLPSSRSEWEWAASLRSDDTASSRERLIAFLTLVQHSSYQSLAAAGWKRSLSGNLTGGFKTVFERKQSSAYLNLLAQRLKYVQLECTTAEALLEATQERPHVTVYCDPPYRGCVTDSYLAQINDHQHFINLLTAQQGAVAVSGYSDTWPELDAAGWHRHEWPAVLEFNIGEPRTECLWMNYQPAPSGRLFE